MKKLATAALLVAIVAGFAVSRVGFADSTAQTDRAELMKRKLADAQKLLEGIALENFSTVEDSAKELNQLSIEAQWTESYSPLYGKFGNEFRAATDRIVASAEDKNLDGVALNYVQLVMACVHCHDAVRGSQDLAFNADQLLEPVGD